MIGILFVPLGDWWGQAHRRIKGPPLRPPAPFRGGSAAVGVRRWGGGWKWTQRDFEPLFLRPSLTAIPRRMHRISSDLRNSAAQGPVSTRVGDRLGRPLGAVSFSNRFGLSHGHRPPSCALGSGFFSLTRRETSRAGSVKNAFCVIGHPSGKALSTFLVG